jgi:hypothetical protein
MTVSAFKEIEALRRRTGKSRSQIVREAVQALKAESSRRAAVKEERAAYRMPEPKAIIDPEERRKRAIAAAGRFRSDLTDLAANHDRYLEDAYATASPAKDAAERD